MTRFLVGFVAGLLFAFVAVLLIGRSMLRRTPPPPLEPAAGTARHTPVVTRESAVAVLNADDVRRRHVVPHASRKET